MGFFEHSEFKYYSFALRAGVTHLLTNGWALGGKKTLGKISQPINSYSRFPEYHHFDNAVREYVSRCPQTKDVKILDIGSPKMFGLYLASTTRAQVHLTDISEVNLDEYRSMWRSLQPKALGEALFSLQDARQLQFPSETFDIVYSMSVVEHVEAAKDDSATIHELIRVLKPGGLLVLSVPFGTHYVEQQREGFLAAIQRTNDGKNYFFQRIYDWPSFERRIIRHAEQLQGVSYSTISRRRKWLPKTWTGLGERTRGALGFLNPIVSALVNESRPGIHKHFVTEYDGVQRAGDLYGDLVMTAQKMIPIRRHAVSIKVPRKSAVAATFNSGASRMGKLILIRHGHTCLNSHGKDERLRGWLDIPLDQQGLEEAEETAELLAEHSVSIIYSSDLRRARQTAEVMRRRTQAARVIATQDLRPWNLGVFAGQRISDILPFLNLLNQHPELAAPSGESFYQFYGRYSSRLLALMQMSLECSGCVVAVTHVRNLLAAKTVVEQGSADRVPVKGGPPTGTLVFVEKTDGVWRMRNGSPSHSVIPSVPASPSDLQVAVA
jgi:broad specificity phosphatase PhoE/ubiquinone/menaquinone biosynthesis C-methylase UbiE